MCIMGNGNDSPACIPSWKFPDEKHEFNEQWFMYINKMVGAYHYAFKKATNDTDILGTDL